MATEVKVVKVRAQSLTMGDVIKLPKIDGWFKITRAVNDVERFAVWADGWSNNLPVGPYDIVELQVEVGEVE